LHVDSDIVLRPDTIQKMLALNRDVVVARYHETSNQRLPESFRHSRVPFRRDAPIDFKENEILEFPLKDGSVILSGLGLVMVKREIYDKLTKPFYLFSSEYQDLSDYWKVCILPHQLVYSEIPKYVEELTNSDYVISSDGKFHPITTVSSRKWDGNILKIVPRTIKLPFEVTPEHKIPVYRDGKEILVRAKDLNPETDLLYLSSPRIIEDVTSIPLAYEFKDVRKDFISSLPSQIEINDEFLNFLGKYVSDGSVSHGNRDRENNLNISLAFNAETELKRMEYYSIYLSNLLNRKFSIFLQERSERNHYSASVKGSCNPLARLLETWFGNGATNKYIPSWIINLSPSKLIPFLRGVWEGDGFQTYSGIKKLPIYAINLSSERLILGIALCLLKLGITFRINEHIQPKEAYGAGNKFWRLVISQDRDKFHYLMTNEREVTRKQKETWSYLKDNRLLYKIEKIEKRHYKGKVWDICVAGDNTFQLRGTISHNSEDFYFLLKLQCEAKVKVTYAPSIAVGHIGECIVWDWNNINFI